MALKQATTLSSVKLTATLATAEASVAASVKPSARDGAEMGGLVALEAAMGNQPTTIRLPMWIENIIMTMSAGVDHVIWT